jgi:RNA polymerase sigma-70 factor (ECF subfamily)
VIAALARSANLVLLAPAGRDAGDDAALVARAREGDPSGFDEIVRRHHKRVYTLACRMLHHPEEAEDVTQEAFLNAYQRLPQLREAESVGAWICRIASNLCLDRLRSPRRHTEVPMPAPELAPADPATADEGTAETVERIRAAMAELPPKYRLAVVAYYLRGHTYEEAARLIGVNVRTFKTHLYRARQRLIAMLEDPTQTREEPP